MNRHEFEWFPTRVRKNYTYCAWLVYSIFALMIKFADHLFFFQSTELHGIRVLIGTLILLISFIRIYNSHFSLVHRVNFELSI